MTKDKHIGLALAGLGLLAIAGALFVGTVAAESVALPQNETFDVNEDTESLRVVAENMSGDLTTTVYEVNDSNGNLTQVATGTLNSSLTTDTYKFTAVDYENVSTYKVSTDGAGAESLVTEKVQAISGGGGMIGGGSGLIGAISDDMKLIGGGLLVLLVGGYAYSRRQSGGY